MKVIVRGVAPGSLVNVRYRGMVAHGHAPIINQTRPTTIGNGNLLEMIERGIQNILQGQRPIQTDRRQTERDQPDRRETRETRETGGTDQERANIIAEVEREENYQFSQRDKEAMMGWRDFTKEGVQRKARRQKERQNLIDAGNARNVMVPRPHDLAWLIVDGKATVDQIIDDVVAGMDYDAIRAKYNTRPVARRSTATGGGPVNVRERVTEAAKVKLGADAEQSAIDRVTEQAMANAAVDGLPAEQIASNVGAWIDAEILDRTTKLNAAYGDRATGKENIVRGLAQQSLEYGINFDDNAELNTYAEQNANLLDESGANPDDITNKLTPTDPDEVMKAAVAILSQNLVEGTEFPYDEQKLRDFAIVFAGLPDTDRTYGSLEEEVRGLEAAGKI